MKKKNVFVKLLVSLLIILTIVNFISSVNNHCFADEDGDKRVNELIQKSVSPVGNVVTEAIKMIVLMPFRAARSLNYILASAGGVAGEPGSTEITPFDIFFNKFPLLDANIFSNTDSEGGELTDFVSDVRTNTAIFYYAIRFLAISVIGIMFVWNLVRAISKTVAADQKAIAKNSLQDWGISFALVMFMHVIIILVININNEFLNGIKSFIDVTDVNTTNFFDKLENAIFHPNIILGIASLIIYAILNFQTLKFIIVYIQRLFAIIVLVIISPLVPIKYSIDKMRGASDTTLNTWFQELVYTVFIQCLHAIIYAALVGVTMTALADTDSITSLNDLGVSIVAICAMLYVSRAEKKVKEILGFDKSRILNTSIFSSTLSTVAQVTGTVTRAGARVATGGSMISFGKNVDGSHIGIGQVAQGLKNNVTSVTDKIGSSAVHFKEKVGEGLQNAPENMARMAGRAVNNFMEFPDRLVDRVENMGEGVERGFRRGFYGDEYEPAGNEEKNGNEVKDDNNVGATAEANATATAEAKAEASATAEATVKIEGNEKIPNENAINVIYGGGVSVEEQQKDKKQDTKLSALDEKQRKLNEAIEAVSSNFVNKENKNKEKPIETVTEKNETIEEHTEEKTVIDTIEFKEEFEDDEDVQKYLEKMKIDEEYSKKYEAIKQEKEKLAQFEAEYKKYEKSFNERRNVKKLNLQKFRAESASSAASEQYRQSKEFEDVLNKRFNEKYGKNWKQSDLSEQDRREYNMILGQQKYFDSQRALYSGQIDEIEDELKEMFEEYLKQTDFDSLYKEYLDSGLLNGYENEPIRIGTLDELLNNKGSISDQIRYSRNLLNNREKEVAGNERAEYQTAEKMPGNSSDGYRKVMEYQARFEQEKIEAEERQRQDARRKLQDSFEEALKGASRNINFDLNEERINITGESLKALGQKVDFKGKSIIEAKTDIEKSFQTELTSLQNETGGKNLQEVTKNLYHEMDRMEKAKYNEFMLENDMKAKAALGKDLSETGRALASLHIKAKALGYDMSVGDGPITHKSSTDAVLISLEEERRKREIAKGKVG